MAPKTRKVSAKSATKKTGTGRATTSTAPPQPEPYDATKFVDEEAQKVYNMMTERTAIKERFMEMVDPYRKYITDHRWGAYGFKARDFHPDIVCEFYANLRWRMPEGVYVRGVRVPFSAKVINDTLGFPNIQEADDQLTAWASRINEPDFDWQPLLDELCIPSRRNTLALNWTYIPKGDIKLKYRPWYYLICHNINPVTINSQVLKARACILYAIVNNWRFDVGRRIVECITRDLNEESGYGFPSLITSLCINKGVPRYSDEPTKKAGTKISLEQFRRKNVGVPVDDEDDEPQPDDADPAVRGRKPSMVRRMARVEQALNAQQAFNSHMARLLAHAFPDSMAHVGPFPNVPPIPNDADDDADDEE